MYHEMYYYIPHAFLKENIEVSDSLSVCPFLSSLQHFVHAFYMYTFLKTKWYVQHVVIGALSVETWKSKWECKILWITQKNTTGIVSIMFRNCDIENSWLWIKTSTMEDVLMLNLEHQSENLKSYEEL